MNRGKEPINVVRNNDLIILTHLGTRKNLHSHKNYESPNTH